MKNVIFYLEDNDTERNALVLMLGLLGFDVEHARDVTEARAVLRRRKDDISVAVLDMLIEDPKHPGVTGGDIGKELMALRPGRPPEFIITTAHRRIDYYALALHLGAAAYLIKDGKQAQLVRVIRALSLRSALNERRRSDRTSFEAIVRVAASQEDAIRGFCSDVLAPELDRLLGAPYLLLLKQAGKTRVAGGEALQGSEQALMTLHACTYGEVGMTEPFVVTPPRQGSGQLPSDVAKLFNELEGSAFIPLTAGTDIKLSLGVLSLRGTGSGEAKELAAVMMHYLRPTIMEALLFTAELCAERTKKMAMLTATSQFCVYTASEQRSLIHAAIEAGEVIQGKQVDQLLELVDGMRDAGDLLSSIEHREGRAAEEISIAAQVSEVWRGLAPLFDADPSCVSIQGDAELLTDREALSWASSRILQWFMQRRTAAPKGEGEGISITCGEVRGQPRVSFEDKSRRLPEPLRKRLFLPFSDADRAPPRSLRGLPGGVQFPLYAAQLLIELRAGGTLTDHTHELSEEIGHRLVMQFPARSARRAKS